MGVYTSTVRLVADTAAAEAALNAIDKKLNEFESGKHKVNIDLNDASAQKELNDLKKLMEDAFNDKNIGKVFKSDTADEYYSIVSQILDDITKLENTDITMKAKADCSQLNSDLDAARAKAEEMLNIDLKWSAPSKDLLGFNSSNITIGDDLEREEARMQRAVSNINNLVKVYKAESRGLQIESTIQRNGTIYGDFNSQRAQENYKNQIAAGREAIEIYSTLIDLVDEYGNISEEDLTSTFGEEGTLALTSTLRQLENQVKNSSDAMKIEADSAGFVPLTKNFDNLNKVITQTNDALHDYKYDSRVSGIQKMFDNTSNIDTDKLADLREQFTGIKDDLNDLGDCYDRNANKLDLSKLFGTYGWDASKLENFNKEFDSFEKSVKGASTELKNLGVDNNLMGKISDGTYAKQIDDLKASFSSLPDGYAKATLNGSVEELDKIYSNMQNAIGSGTAQGYAEASKNAREFTQKAQEANQAYQQFMLGSGTSTSGGGGTGGGGGGGNIFMGDLTSGSGKSNGSWFSGFTTDLSQGLTSAASYVNRFLGYNAIYREARQAAQEMVQTVKEIDTAMNQLQIVTGASSSEMSDFFESSVSQAKDLGQSVTDVLDTIQVYSRLGYNLEDASELSEYTSILSNVAAVDIEDATSGLTSVIKGFNLDVEDSEHVADVLTVVGQNYAVSASEILEAFEKSSAAMAASNTTFEESAAIIAAGIFAFICQKIAEMQFSGTHLIARTS